MEQTHDWGPKCRRTLLTWIPKVKFRFGSFWFSVGSKCWIPVYSAFNQNVVCSIAVCFNFRFLFTLPPCINPVWFLSVSICSKFKILVYSFQSRNPVWSLLNSGLLQMSNSILRPIQTGMWTNFNPVLNNYPFVNTWCQMHKVHRHKKSLIYN